MAAGCSGPHASVNPLRIVRRKAPCRYCLFGPPDLPHDTRTLISHDVGRSVVPQDSGNSAP